MTDQNPLSDFVRSGSQAAFAQVVQQHVALVWSTARRQVGDAHLAEDITQQVFALLARKAAELDGRVILSGWLYRTTCHLAFRTRRGEQRRWAREQLAVHAMYDTNPPSLWHRIEPHFDAALASLNERDRDAVVLRYFENRSLREVGAALGTNEDAAQKRLARALEKLRGYFGRRGETVTMGALAAAIGSGAVQPAPAALAAAVSVGAAALSLSTTSTFLSWTMLKPAIAAIAIVTLAATVAVQTKANRTLRAERDALAASSPPAPRPVAPAGPSFNDTPEFAELLRLRGEVTRLRASEAELARLRKELASLHDALARAPGVPAPATPPEAASADENHARTASNLKQIGLGLRMLANEKADAPFLTDGRLSAELVKMLGGTETVAMKLFQNVTLLVSDSQTMARLEREAPNKIVARTINAYPLPDGNWNRLYLLADGSVTQRRHADEHEIWDGIR